METITKLAPILYFIGQILEIVGAFLLFRFSMLPSLKKLSGGGIAWNQMNMLTPEEQEKESRSIFMNRLGFLLVFLGFLFQFPTAFINVFK